MPSLLPAGIRAVFFDVYGTLLDGPRRDDRGQKMSEVARQFGLHPIPQLDQRLDQAIQDSHAQSSEPFPEIDIRELWQAIFPDLGDRDRFAFEVEEAIHPVSIVPQGAVLLEQAVQQGAALGVISNAQAYTRSLLAQHFPHHWKSFDSELLVFSYEHRIAKPDLRLFQTAQLPLLRRGFQPDEILMVGDSPGHDLLPAAQLGWRTLQIE
ncbi:FMN phosphatase YigB (HAD superfamily) [Haloferula luteola]|uniref:FMN phosphatase YigB (HAD superfamily) n=1 Tax=Haloferula luteola TaxID=595692 RepID=A0A840V698_9BACT|nr:HAD family hydrolase [Haloferula luteola]MBB5353787.1 FMN phosphatase YigB (HAD superfamily) [Haloferula luteola]